MSYGESSIRGILARNTSTFAGHAAYIYDDTAYSWVRVEEDVNRAARRLLALGVKRGTHVGVWGMNSYAWVVCVLACMEIGACAVLANYSFRRADMSYLTRYGKVEYMLVGQAKEEHDGLSVARSIMQDAPLLKKCISMDDIAFVSDIQPASEASLDEACAFVEPGDPAYIIFTSGTTKNPKGVVLTQQSVLRMADTIAEHLSLTSDDTQVIALALFHGSGINACIMPALRVGACSVLLKCFSSMKVLDAIARHRCTVFNSIPTLVLLMTRHESFASFDISSLRCGIWSGGAISNDQFAGIRHAISPMKIAMAYGQTEATTLSTMTELSDSESLTCDMCGFPLKGVDLRIRDTQSGSDCPCGVIGEIQIGGYSRMKGYFELPEETAKAFTSDGWLKTGDLGFVDETGQLRFVARADEMIVRGGENISPLEIETAIQSFSETIGAVKVVGMPSALFGQEVAAVFTAGEKLSECELRAFLSAALSKFKMPSYLRQIDEMPYTASGKIDKKAVVALIEKSMRSTGLN